MRATHLAVLTGAAALLGACASTGIRSDGGDVFILENSSLSGSRAVERGIAEARDYCAANGRQFLVQDSRIGSGNYQLQFRCVAPYGAARAGGVDPLLAAAATPVVPAGETPRRRRARRADAAYLPPADPVSEPALAETPRPARRSRRTRGSADQPQAILQPIPASSLPSRFARPEAAPQEEPVLPPVATTPLFNPRGASFPPPVATPARRIPPDAGPFMPLAQPADATPAVASAPPAAAARAPAGDGLPPIQLPPAAAASANYGASVPSPQALPGAPSALTPIASPLRPIPAAVPAPSTNTPPQGFFGR